MADVSYSEPSQIEAILNEASRLKFLLSETYGVAIATISALRVDGDNFKLDITTPNLELRLKVRDVEEVFIRNPETGIMELNFDPALAQDIYRLVEEWTEE